MKGIWLRLRMLMSLAALDAAERLAPWSEPEGKIICDGIWKIFGLLTCEIRRRKMPPDMDGAK